MPWPCSKKKNNADLEELKKERLSLLDGISGMIDEAKSAAA